MKKQKPVYGKIVFDGSFIGYLTKFVLNIPFFILTLGAWYFYWNSRYFNSHLKIELYFEDKEEEEKKKDTES